MATTVIAHLLLRGLDDWFDLDDVVIAVSSMGRASTEDDVQEEVLATTKKLLQDQLAIVGDVTSSGFVAWQTSAEDSIQRIKRQWCALNRPISLGDVCWFENTSEGNELAQYYEEYPP